MSKMPNFRVKSVKIYTGQKKYYTDISVGSVTNMRYVAYIISQIWINCIVRLSFRGFTIALVIDFFYSGGMMIKKETVKIFKTIQRRRCNFWSCLGANLSSSNPTASIPKPQHTRNYIFRYLVKMLIIRNDKFCWNLWYLLVLHFG